MSMIAVGYQALINQFKLQVIPHYRQSYITPRGRGQVRIDNHQETYVYPKTYAVKDLQNPFNHLEFALKHEGINLEILQAVFNQLDGAIVQATIQERPTSKYARSLWFLYEFLTEKKLDLPSITKVKYFDLLDPKHYFTSPGIKSPRHCVNNNLIGNRDFCPMLRKTEPLKNHINNHYDLKVRALADRYDPRIITRASYYFYTKETLSSYEIEQEKPSKERLNRFIHLLQKASSIETLSKKLLIELQNIIVDPRFQDANYRFLQNYVGETINQYIQKIHYIPPKPESVERLMSGLLQTLENAMHTQLHPVLTAAIISFGFVFIHPFEDGNGRIHRFLIHYILARMQFTPPDIIFPISAVMLQKMREYDRALESFSKPLMDLITQYQLSNEGFLSVQQSTDSYYPFIDYTHLAEYLFGCIQETLREHFEKELEFLVNYDKTKAEMKAEIDMPDRLIDLFIKFVIQNHGTLSIQKRKKYFEKLSNQEIESLQSIVRAHMLDLESK